MQTNTLSLSTAKKSWGREVGTFEVTLLASIRALKETAWGSNLQRHLSSTLGRDVAVGQLYLALSKLERRGFISSKTIDPEPTRGGRRKKVFHLEASAVEALDRISAVVNTTDALPLAERKHGELAY